MGPLVYYSRWQGAKLRLRGRDDQFIWGEFVFREPEGERTQAFRFDQKSWVLSVMIDGFEQQLQLDELGVIMTSAGDEPQ